MKKSIITSALVLALGLFATSCTEEAGGFGSGSGHIAPLVGFDSDVEGMGTALSRAGDEITVDDLSLILSKNDGSFRQTWNSVSEFDTNKEFPVGNYTLTAFYGDPETEGFELPAYSGSVPVRVADGQTSSVSLTATLVNAKVSVVFTDEFKKYMADYSGQFVTSTATHQYAKDEVRPLYIAPGQATFNVHVKKPNGNDANFEVAKINAQARHHYVITVNVNSGNVSDAVLEVTFDDTLEQQPVHIDLSDEIMSTPAPSLSTEGFTPGTPVELVAGIPTTAKAQVNITALAGFKSVTLTTQSEYLLKNGWPESVDLLDPETKPTTFTDKGLKVVGLWQKVGTMALIDFAPVAEYVTAGTHSFTVTVTDQIGRTVEEPVTVELNLSEPEFSIAAVEGQYYSVDMPVSFALTANIPLTKETLKVEYPNSRGTTSQAEILGFEEQASRAASKNYKITIMTPDDVEGELKIKVCCGRVGSNQIVINETPFDIALTANDVFATYSLLDVVPTEGNTVPDLSGAQIVFQSANGTFSNATQTVSGTTFTVSSLKPDTDYTVRAKIGDAYSKPHSFHTEAAPQLANSDMEKWTSTKVSSGANSWQKYTPASPWSTLNDYTLSKVNMTCVRSGAQSTESTTDAHQGTAALVQTVGWDAATTFNSCGIHTAGEIFLGTADSNGNKKYGTPFSSRPSALKFWCKFTQFRSGETGVAEIEVVDAANNVIATGKLLPNNASWQQQTIALKYSRNAAKAASIRIRFVSNANQSLGKSDVTSFRSGNTSTRPVGSKLYIDDIELIY